MNVREVAKSNYDDINIRANQEISNKTEVTDKQVFDSEAAVYTKTSSKKGNYNVANKETVNRLIEESNRRAEQLKDMVEKMLVKQGQTFNQSTNIYHLIRDGKLDVDPETRAQAKKDIAPGGYWSVEATSDRLVSFAKAVAGDDPVMADKMINAVKKGFDEATKAWGKKLPQISHDTLDATMEKLDAWRAGLK